MKNKAGTTLRETFPAGSGNFTYREITTAAERLIKEWMAVAIKGEDKPQCTSDCRRSASAVYGLWFEITRNSPEQELDSQRLMHIFADSNTR